MIEIRRIEVDKTGLAEIAHFLQESFPKSTKFTEAFVKWQYADNPLGRMEGFNAWVDGKIVSHFAGLPINMNLFGKQCKGLLCINVSTNINYRGEKLFTKLGQQTVEYATANGYDFMIAVPNANSTHAFLKYFGFYLISPLIVKLGFGANIYTKKSHSCFKIWDDAQWNWRLSSPANTYFYKKNTISVPITFFAKSVSYAELSKDIERKISDKIGLRWLSLYIGLGANTLHSFYLNMPSFVKRPPFNLVFKDLTGNIPKIEKEDFFLQLIDLDTV